MFLCMCLCVYVCVMSFHIEYVLNVYVLGTIIYFCVPLLLQVIFHDLVSNILNRNSNVRIVPRICMLLILSVKL